LQLTRPCAGTVDPRCDAPRLPPRQPAAGADRGSGPPRRTTIDSRRSGFRPSGSDLRNHPAHIGAARLLLTRSLAGHVDVSPVRTPAIVDLTIVSMGTRRVPNPRDLIPTR